MFTKFTTTGIGSMPHRDPERACRIILDRVDIPFWPQLPAVSFKELMIPQYSEGLPGVRIDPQKEKVWIGGGQSELNEFYEKYTEETELAISEEYARGFYAFMNLAGDRRFDMLKGHVTGPLTFTLGLKDGKGLPAYFNEELREISLMVLRGKVRWQICRLKELAGRVMIFIDEPILSALGTSAYMGVSEDETRRLLADTVSAIKNAGGISAIHCCGKADWQLVIESGIDVVNFDAFEYFDNLQIYSGALRKFLDRGGYIAAGIVPTGKAIHEATPGQLRERILAGLHELKEKTGFSDLSERVLLTPSCGTGSLKEAEAEKVFQTLNELKKELLK